jgi:dienelactone hydrolase
MTLLGVLAAGALASMQAAVEAPPPAPTDAADAGAMRAYLADRAAAVERTFLSGIEEAAAFEQRRPRLREELLDMIGLWPPPERTPLKAQVTGRLRFPGFTVEKIHFQSRPGLYVTANLYLPRPLRGRVPAILYQAGHADSAGRNGAKTAYQDHGIWFATHGYACLIIDTVQLGEIAGRHRGTAREGLFWWQSLGYTPAGTETWAAMRALDYLVSRREIDPGRIGATGISGGGGATVWIAATDDRVAAAAPVSGMGDLGFYVAEGGVDRHCDCMLLYNTRRWSWATIAALAAPRPFLFVNSSEDRYFPMSANERVAARLERAWALHGASDRVDAVVSVGKHEYRSDVRRAVFEFMNRALRTDARPVTDPDAGLGADGKPRIPPEQLRVFPDDKSLPSDHVNARAEDAFVTAAAPEQPDAPGFEAWRKDLLERLRRTSLAAWPEAAPEHRVAPLGDREADGTEPTEPGIGVSWRWLPGRARGGPAWIIVQNAEEPRGRVPAWARPVAGDAGLLIVSPRRGPAGPGTTTVARALPLLGTTIDAGRIWDVVTVARRRAGSGPWHVAGQGNAGIIAAYAALFEPALARVHAIDPPPSHRPRAKGDGRYGPPLLKVLRVLDIPDALGCLAPRPLTLAGTGAEDAAFDRTAALYRLAQAADRFERSSDRRRR